MPTPIEMVGYRPTPAIGLDGCVLYLPAWFEQCSQGTFYSLDKYRHLCTDSNVAWGSQGRTYNATTSTTIVTHHASQLLTTGGTIAAWIRPDSIGEGGFIVDKSTGTNGQNGYKLQISGTEDKLAVVINNGTAKVSAVGSFTLGDGNWYYVVATWDATGLVTIYVNGVQSGTPGISADPVGITTTNALTLGNRSGATDRTFDGIIGEVIGYNRALSAGGIAHIYSATSWRYV